MAETSQWRHILERHLKFYEEHREYLRGYVETEFLAAIRMALELIDSQEQQLKEVAVLRKLFADLCIDNELLAKAKEEGRRGEREQCYKDCCRYCEQELPVEYQEQVGYYVHIETWNGEELERYCEANAIRLREDTAGEAEVQ